MAVLAVRGEVKEVVKVAAFGGPAVAEAVAEDVALVGQEGQAVVADPAMSSPN